MARKPKKYHYIYKTTCKITGKFYVGMHSTDNVEDGYLGSGKILGYSRKKYGDENHVREILEFCSSRDELKQREKEIVNEALLADPLNINLKYGGEGGWDHLDSDAIKRRGLAISKFRRGMVFDVSHRISIAKSKIGNKNFSNSTRFSGKSCSGEHRRKIGEANKKMVGQLNSQYGTCWVVKSGLAKKIKKEFLEEYLSNGYSPGRK